MPPAGIIPVVGQSGRKEGTDMQPPERVVMGEFEGAVLSYHPDLHVYEVVLGEDRETFPATWEPRFGMDVDDVRSAEEALDRILARRAAAG